MTNTAIFWPLIVQTILIYFVYFAIVNRRKAAVKSGEATFADYRVPVVEPKATASVARNLENQFELPVLFYAVCLALYMVNGVNDLTIVVAWLFVLSRIGHSWIHLSSNQMRLRTPIFTIGFLLNGLLWLWLAWRLLQ